ncbi:MAG: sigma-70 family RNA polymerase sigma factor [Candidatus Aenigmatarchaeota archaeon]
MSDYIGFRLQDQKPDLPRNLSDKDVLKNYGSDALAEKYIPLAVGLANNLSTSPQEYDDIIQEAMTIIVELSKRFDPNRNVKFSTYARHLRGKMLDYVNRIRHAISLPEFSHEIISKISSHQTNCGAIDVDRISRETGHSTNVVRSVLSVANSDLPLDNTPSPSDEHNSPSAYGSFLVTENHKKLEPEHALYMTQMIDELNRGIGSLTTRERTIIVGSFVEKKSGIELAREMGIFPGYVTRITQKALNRMQQRYPELAEYLDEEF